MCIRDRVHGDAGQLASVVRNLVENAGRHASEVVRVSVSSDGERARMVVEDDGPGVPPDQRDLVFERFGRMEEALSLIHIWGLGHRGNLRLRSN